MIKLDGFRSWELVLRPNVQPIVFKSAGTSMSCPSESARVITRSRFLVLAAYQEYSVVRLRNKLGK